MLAALSGCLESASVPRKLPCTHILSFNPMRPGPLPEEMEARGASVSCPRVPSCQAPVQSPHPYTTHTRKPPLGLEQRLDTHR